MVRTITRTSSVRRTAEDEREEFARLAQQYKQIGEEEKDLSVRKDALKSRLVEAVTEFGEPDEKGHRRFPIPAFQVGKKVYSQIVHQKRTSERLNEDRTRDLLEDLSAENGVDLVSRVIKTVTVKDLDQDEIYALYAEDVLNDKQVDSLIDKSTTWAFTVET